MLAEISKSGTLVNYRNEKATYYWLCFSGHLRIFFIFRTLCSDFSKYEATRFFLRISTII